MTKLRLQYPKQQLVIEKDNEEWKGVEPYSFKTSKEKIEKILKVMTNLQAVEIPVQSFEGTGLEKNDLIIQITGENGLDNTLMVGDEYVNEETGVKLYYAKKGDSDNIYLISEEEKDKLVTTIVGLR